MRARVDGLSVLFRQLLSLRAQASAALRAEPSQVTQLLFVRRMQDSDLFITAALP